MNCRSPALLCAHLLLRAVILIAACLLLIACAAIWNSPAPADTAAAMPPLTLPAARAALSPFTVGGWNIGLDDADPQAIAQLLADYQGVELWGLAEVNDGGGVVSLLEKAAEAGENADFRAVLGTSGDAMRLLAIYNAQRYDLLDWEELDAINTTGSARAPLVLHLREKSSGAELLFMVNHLYRSRDHERLRQAGLLAQWAAEQTLPIIAVGDYNFDWAVRGGERNHDPAYTALTANGVWDWVRPATLVTTQCSGWPCTYNTVLDFVFTAGPAQNWPARSVIVVIPGDFPDDTRRSDHRAVLAQFAPNGVAGLAGEIVLPPQQMPAALLGAAPTLAVAPVTSTDSNLRAGPSTIYPIVGGTVTGQRLEGELAIIGQSADAQWFALANGSWIRGNLVIGAPNSGLPIMTGPDPDVVMATTIAALATLQATLEPNIPAAPLETPDPRAAAQVVIADIFYDGVVPEVESDEYIVLVNEGIEPVNLRGWRVNAGSKGQDFLLPDHWLPPGAGVRIYTDEAHPDNGWLSFGSHQPLWRNGGDCGYLFDPGGVRVSEYCY